MKNSGKENHSKLGPVGYSKQTCERSGMNDIISLYHCITETAVIKKEVGWEMGKIGEEV